MVKRLAAVLTALTLVCGCGNDVGPGGHDVGASCRIDQNCGHRCHQSVHFPQGLCTKSCLEESNCPDGTVCVDEADGICELTCPHTTCSDLGKEFICDSMTSKSGSEVMVCRVP